MTALPHPAKVSQNVPIASAAHFRTSMISSRVGRSAAEERHRQSSIQERLS
jgi:hypothetical protein